MGRKKKISNFFYKQSFLISWYANFKASTLIFLFVFKLNNMYTKYFIQIFYSMAPHDGLNSLFFMGLEKLKKNNLFHY